jgi:DNA-binding beta-propeller fold protein YncE
VDPKTNRAVGQPLVLGSPQSLAFGGGALWVADHTGWLVKIDPTTFMVVARQRLDFGPHGIVITDDAVYVADAHDSRLLAADPKTAEIRLIEVLPVGPIHPVVGVGSIWSSSAAVWEGETTQDDRVVRIDPKTLAVVATFHRGAPAPSS